MIELFIVLLATSVIVISEVIPRITYLKEDWRHLELDPNWEPRGGVIRKGWLK